MRIETQEAVASIYLRVSKQLKSAKLARNSSAGMQSVMLAGKVKAYVDVLSFLRNKYRKKMTLWKEIL